MQVTAHQPGTFCWVELATTDQQAARRFYEGLLGWTSQDYPIGSDETYTITRRNGLDVGGLYALSANQRAEGVPAHWLTYIAVSSADATADRVAEAGGTVVTTPFDVGENGRMAVLADPLGAMFALWQPKTHPGARITGEAGAVCWTELATSDLGAVRPFYARLFGWRFEKSPVPDMPYTIALIGDERVCGLYEMTGDMWTGVPSHWMTYFAVDDCDERASWASGNGATVVVPPSDIPTVGRYAVIKDPQGGVFSIIRLAEMAK
jgi:predicted enzyme related to lactoylglutathione lyase